MRVFVAVFARDGGLLFGVPMVIVLAAPDAIDVVESDVEPDRRIERAVLVDAEPGQFLVEDLGVGLRGEVAVLKTAIGDGLADAVDELLDGMLALAVLDVAVEILADNDFRG